jgi:hypothetical protein
MPAVYCHPVELTIADLICAKSICSQTQVSHIITIIDLACSVCTVKDQTSEISHLGLIFHSTDLMLGQ